MKNIALFLITSFYVLNIFSQTPIVTLRNSSFEDLPRTGKAPKDWYDCGFPTESAVDVQPSSSSSVNFFGVTQQPSHGQTYLGMVARDNETWEMVAQRLSTPIVANQHYKFSIDLCRSETYISLSRTTSNEVNYTTPVKLRVWAGNGYCSKKQLLAETPLVINTQWLTFELAFLPEEDWKYLLLECFYKAEMRFPYNGNLLVDNASPIFPIDKIEADSIFARIDTPTTPQKKDYSSFVDRTPPPSPSTSRKSAKKTTSPPFDYDKARSSTFSNNADRPVKKEKTNKRKPSRHDWKSNSDMPDAVKNFLSNMEVDFDKGTFGGTTRINLIYILGNIVRLPDFNTMTVGVAGKGKELKKLKQPFLQFMEEFGIPEKRIQFKKVKDTTSENDWNGKNQWYWIKVE